MKKHSGCNLCLHPTCPQGFYVNGIASCLQCDNGVLVLDPSSGPKWKVGCNKCDVIFHLFEDAHKITVEESKECDCGAQLLKIEYKEVFITSNLYSLFRMMTVTMFFYYYQFAFYILFFY